MDNLKYRIVLSFFLLLCANSLAQELPPVQNFTPVDYKAENQNWNISQSQDKLIYVANNKGLLEYNGANWTLYPTPNETIMRSVTAIGSKIYTGSYMEFGYWQKNELGVLEYTSLSTDMGIDLIEDEEFWNIIGVDDYVIFQSLDRIYIYNALSNSVNTITSEQRIINVYDVEGSIYFQRIDKGIFKIENGRDILFLDNEVVKNNEVVNIFSIRNALILVTRDNGIFSYDKGILREWQKALNNRLQNVSVYSASQLRNDDFLLGTIADGLIYIDQNSNVSYEINQGNGLLNNTVLSVFEDTDNTIWLALDNGISYINSDAPFKIYKDQKGLLGSVYTSAIFGDNLYFGTNQGLFYRPFLGSDEFTFIRGTEGQVWSLKAINNELFCGHHRGTFVINEDNAKKVSNTQGTWSIEMVDQQPDLLIQGNYDGLYILERSNGNWEVRNKILGFNNSSRYLELLGNLIFVNHEYKGVFKIEIDDSFTKAKNVVIDTLLKGANSALVKHKGAILFAFREGVLKYNSTEKRFIKDSLLSTIYTKDSYISGRILSEKGNDRFWLFSKDNLTLVAPGELANVPKFITIPLTHEERNNVVEYENIIATETEEKYVLGTSSGYIILDLNKIEAKEFMVYLDKVDNGIKKDRSASKNLLDKNHKGDFKSYENTLGISYFTPSYNKYLRPTYQFRLLGIYDDWSQWSQESSVFFENLPYGDYTFDVRAKIGNEVSQNIASYDFTIAKPWYITNVMLAVYAFGILLFSVFMHNVYKRHYRKEQLKLIERNRRELEFAKVQNEKKIIQIRSEKLEKEFKSKSKELAASTMSIVKKNELLAQIKDRLLRLNNSKEALEPVIQVIDRNLNHNDNWEFFKEAFDNADSEFFKTLKEVHPNLSPNDLKLCAYLRLNLSSKEIAPMFNISARSVEIKRYRLRKKMRLSSNQNLTNYILSL
ncbi:MAG: triple tyrosine motif-containing protein [Flavobacteriaceae bacterium]|nr:triple tyrosine motif-containing protein [Flavobacteriaceae bacterium]